MKTKCNNNNIIIAFFGENFSYYMINNLKFFSLQINK